MKQRHYWIKWIALLAKDDFAGLKKLIEDQ